MAVKSGYLLLGIAAIAFIALSSFTGGNVNTNVDFTNLTNDPNDLQRLQNLFNSLWSAGLTPLQIKMCLAQILVETGLLTNQANYVAMDQRNNYAGLTKVSGGYASYPDIDSFVNAYIGFLTKGANPLGASNIQDFNSRLVANHYYTDSPVTYGNNLAYYFNNL